MGFVQTSHPVIENKTVKVISGSKGSFTFIYILLCFLFSMLIIFSIIALALLIIGITAGGVSIESILSSVIKSITFNTGNLPKPGDSGDVFSIIFASYCAVIGLCGGILAVITGLLLKLYKKHKIIKLDLIALLPGRKRGFIPCEQGIYKLIYINIITGSRFYGFYPWEVLFLHYIDSKSGCIFLKHKHFQICLDGRARNNYEYDYSKNLKDIIMTFLSDTHRIPPVKRDGFRWWLAASLIVLVIGLGFMGGIYYESISCEGNGSIPCDAGGDIHYFSESYNRYGMSSRAYVYEIYSGTMLKHRYCLLHGSIYAVLHPIIYIESMSRTIAREGLGPLVKDPMAVFFLLFIPSYLWIFTVILIILVSRPQVLRFHSL